MKVEEHSYKERQKLQKAFGYTYEDVMTSILPMAKNGTESIAAMGTDSPLAVLSKEPQPLFNYFKQLFAQVTNPPKIHNPILTSTDILKIKNMHIPGFKVAVIPILYYKNTRLSKAVKRLFIEADKAYNDGANILILSDRGVDENHLAIPSLLAVSALHQHLVATKKRTSLAMILESGEPREVHHFATLLGYGASAINPYLAQETIHELIGDDLLDKDYYAAVDDYNSAVLHGIVKIASKMGISTIQSYQGSQIFEAIGIGKDVIDEYFTGTVSRIGGITIKDIEKNVDKLHTSV